MLPHLAATASENALALAGIILACTPLILAGAYRFRNRAPNEAVATGLAEDAVERVKRLKADIAELTQSLEECRSQRRLEHAEGRLKDMHIGTLEAQLAEAKKQLRKEERRND